MWIKYLFFCHSGCGGQASWGGIAKLIYNWHWIPARCNCIYLLFSSLECILLFRSDRSSLRYNSVPLFIKGGKIFRFSIRPITTSLWYFYFPFLLDNTSPNHHSASVTQVTKDHTYGINTIRYIPESLSYTFLEQAYLDRIWPKKVKWYSWECIYSLFPLLPRTTHLAKQVGEIWTGQERWR